MAKNVFWNTFGTIFYCACQWLMTIVVVRFSDNYEAAGYLSLAMTTSSSFSAITLFSMRNFQVSDVRSEYSSGEYVGSRFLTCALGLVLCIVYSAATSSVYQMLCVASFMLIRVAEGLVDVLHGINQKYDRYDYIGISYILRGVITILAFSIILYVKDQVFTALIVTAILNLLIALLWDWFRTSSLEKLSPVFWNEQVKRLLIACVPIVVFSFLLSVENLFPKSMLQQMLGTEELGIYSSIASPTLVVQVFAQVAFNPFLPKISMLYAEKRYEDFSKYLHKVYLALAGLCVVVCIGAVLLGRWGLNLLFGKDILQYYDLFMPIIWCTILTAFIWVLYAIVVAMRQIKWLLVGMIADFILCLAITRPCIAGFGKNGVSVSQIVAYGVYVLFIVILCESVLRKEKRRV